jgi:hypothetical protein
LYEELPAVKTSFTVGLFGKSMAAIILHYLLSLLARR